VLELDDFVPFYMRAIANRLAQAASRFYSEKFGIGLTEWSCLAALAKEKHISASRICEISGFDKGLISRGLGALEAKGYIESRPVPEHNRKRLIDLTPTGLALYREIRHFALDREERLLAGLSPQQRAQLIEMLRTMHRNAIGLVADNGDGSRASGEPRA
jgi:DNA-binding MarR family transcriptional regulator